MEDERRDAKSSRKSISAKWPNDPESDTFLAVIIKTVFPSKKERTIKNATWAQSVLEAIFDENHLSPKIDVNIVEMWIEALADTEMDLVNILVWVYVLVF